MSEFEGKIIEDYYDYSQYGFEGEYRTKGNDPDFRGGQYLGKEIGVRVQFAIHTHTNGRIIINVPGAGGNIDGYKDKFKKQAKHMQSSNLGAVIRTNGDLKGGFLPDINLRAALAYAKEHSQEICGSSDPEILLMGFSAGASAIAAVAHEYPEVSKILLYAPSGEMPEEITQDGLAKFQGDVIIVIGENDDVVGVEAGQIFYDWASSASTKELFIIPECDHQFRGEVNGRIMSEAPFYAFSQGEKILFPDPNGGIKLYE
ncbi:MAG TPA: hypothetical protein VK338_01785 [Candidatus Nitrosocosmicus sp.]|nr:hypothetical protein [Candidatus Nitrosocosmicus sp.]